MKIDDFDLFQKLIENYGPMKKEADFLLVFSGAKHGSRCCVGLYSSGNLSYIMHYADGSYLPTTICRDPAEGPAYESFFLQGGLHVREYVYLGKRYRNCYDGPAYEIFNRNGEVVKKQFYYKNDEERLRHIASGAAE
jgi:hypothetical protein